MVNMLDIWFKCFMYPPTKMICLYLFLAVMLTFQFNFEDQFFTIKGNQIRHIQMIYEIRVHYVCTQKATPSINFRFYQLIII